MSTLPFLHRDERTLLLCSWDTEDNWIEEHAHSHTEQDRTLECSRSPLPVRQQSRTYRYRGINAFDRKSFHVNALRFVESVEEIHH